MTSDTETLTKSRIWLVSILALSFLLSQLASLSFAADLTRLSNSALDLIDNVGFVILLLTVLAGAWILRSARQRGTPVNDALNDELAEHNFKMAAVFGFKLVFILSLALFILTKLIMISGEDVARILMTACFVGAYLRFAVLESRDA